VLAAWGLAQLGLLGHGAVTGRWPWNMFGDPEAHRRRFALEAREADGPWEPLPLGDLFRWRRGFTELGVLDDAYALYGRGGRRERRAFVTWAVAELAPGRPYVEARLTSHEVSIRTGHASVDDLGTFPLPAP
jgi:hypothetical protein